MNDASVAWMLQYHRGHSRIECMNRWLIWSENDGKCVVSERSVVKRLPSKRLYFGTSFEEALKYLSEGDTSVQRV